MKPSLSESDIQIQVADLLRLHERARGFLFFSVSNEALGAARSGAALGRMARLKRMGLRAGVSDLVIVRSACAYFIEIKTHTGTQSKNQVCFERDCEIAGAPYAVAHSFDEAAKILQSWSIIP
jgi:hypothetical protein